MIAMIEERYHLFAQDAVQAFSVRLIMDIHVRMRATQTDLPSCACAQSWSGNAIIFWQPGWLPMLSCHEYGPQIRCFNSGRRGRGADVRD